FSHDTDDSYSAVSRLFIHDLHVSLRYHFIRSLSNCAQPYFFSCFLRQTYVPKWNVINDSALDDPEACFSAEVRLRSEHKYKEMMKFERKCQRQVDLLKEKDTEIANLKAQLSLKEAEAAEAIRLRSQVAAIEGTKVARVDELNSLKGWNTTLKGQVVYGFGWARSNDYKVVAVSNETNQAKIYSVNSRCWKNLPHFGKVGSFRGDVVYVKGCIHWFHITSQDRLWKIFSFDLKVEGGPSAEIMQPNYDDGEEKTLCLGVLGKWLCIVCNYAKKNVVDLWVMKKYGVQESWSKFTSIPYPNPDIYPFLDVTEGCTRFSPPLWMADDKILLGYGGVNFLLYD
ncbi:gypsy type transposase, partial [Tanacetum coccineum]